MLEQGVYIMNSTISESFKGVYVVFSRHAGAEAFSNSKYFTLGKALEFFDAGVGFVGIFRHVCRFLSCTNTFQL